MAGDEVELGTRVGRALNRWPTAGLAVGVVRDGSFAWFHGSGVADVRSGTPVDEDTVFRIASITKTITAIAVMQRWEQGWSTSTRSPTTTFAATRWCPPRPASGRRRCGS
jgi:CubicO group peptidase (beta-lactamase class C family)